MAPLVPKFPVESLPDHVNIVSHSNFQEKRRKPPVDLKQCSLHEMTQYSCNPPDEGIPQPGVIVCKPLVRLFRRCAGGLTVETTSWEPLQQAEEAKRKTEGKTQG
ncbi:Mitochondrial export protein Som1 [Aspergillus sp. HF37]|nr:Mitochondrial export protein Som1 [Aspergillus sp. HF37]